MTEGELYFPFAAINDSSLILLNQSWQQVPYETFSMLIEPESKNVERKYLRSNQKFSSSFNQHYVTSDGDIYALLYKDTYRNGHTLVKIYKDKTEVTTVACYPTEARVEIEC